MAQNRTTRRLFLWQTAALAAGGELALHHRLSLAAAAGGGHPLAPRPGHFAPKAKHLILFFFTGGLSHVDTFDYKPKLQEDHGKKISGASKPLKASQWKFQPYGQCGKMVSELFPHVGRVVDEFCFLHTIRGDSGGHSAATLGMLTGSITFPMPSIGSWISYGLGTRNTNLPPYIVLAAKEPYNAYLAWVQATEVRVPGVASPLAPRLRPRYAAEPLTRPDGRRKDPGRSCDAARAGKHHAARPQRRPSPSAGQRARPEGPQHVIRNGPR